MLRGLLLSAPHSYITNISFCDNPSAAMLASSFTLPQRIPIFTKYKIQNYKKHIIPIQRFDSTPRVRHSESEILHKWKRGWIVMMSILSTSSQRIRWKLRRCWILDMSLQLTYPLKAITSMWSSATMPA